ncbi:hypothetical protein D3C80_415110 [compost metagenome]
MLDDAADRGGRQQELADIVFRRILVEMQEILERCGNDAGSAVGRRRHDATAAGIFLVHRHGVNREPVIGEEGIGPVAAPFLVEAIMDRPRPPLDLEPARHDAIDLEATIDTAVHRLPDRVYTLVQRLRARVGQFVGPLHLRDRKTRAVGHLEHLPGGRKRIGHTLATACVLRCAHCLKLGIGNHETSADRVIDPLEKQPAILVERRKAHAVGVSWQSLLLVEDQVCLRLEVIGRMTGWRHAACPLHLFDDRVHPVRIDSIRRFAHQAENDRPARSMPDAGEGERAMQRSLKGGNMRTGGTRPVVGQDEVEKPVGRRHRPHRVGTRRADADLENVEDGEKHGSLQSRYWPDTGCPIKLGLSLCHMSVPSCWRSDTLLDINDMRRGSHMLSCRKMRKST